MGHVPLWPSDSSNQSEEGGFKSSETSRYNAYLCVRQGPANGTKWQVHVPILRDMESHPALDIKAMPSTSQLEFRNSWQLLRSAWSPPPPAGLLQAAPFQIVILLCPQPPGNLTSQNQDLRWPKTSPSRAPKFGFSYPLTSNTHWRPAATLIHGGRISPET